MIDGQRVLQRVWSEAAIDYDAQWDCTTISLTSLSMT